MASAIGKDATRSPGGWKWTLAYGVALIVIGVLAVSWPFASAVVIGLFLGWVFCVAGIFGIVAGLQTRHVRGHRLDILAGVLSLVLGLLILPFPLASALGLLWAMSIWFTISAAMEFAFSFRHRHERIPLLLLGVLDLVLAVLLFAGFVHGDVGLVAILAGISFIASGVATVFAALGLRALQRAENA